MRSTKKDMTTKPVIISGQSRHFLAISHFPKTHNCSIKAKPFWGMSNTRVTNRGLIFMTQLDGSIPSHHVEQPT